VVVGEGTGSAGAGLARVELVSERQASAIEIPFMLK
jgi:hypothetical protein